MWPKTREGAQRMLAGVGRCDITPAPATPQGGWGAQSHERGVGADMPMLVTALAVAQGDERFVLLDVDAIGFNVEWTNRIVEAVAKLTELPVQRIRFSCSHTHSGANTFRLKNISQGLEMAVSYLESLPQRIAGAAWQAVRQMVPVQLGVGTGECHINRNRRVQTPEGETVVGVNDGVATDSSVGVIRLDREDGSVLATLVHYACHPTTVGWQNEWFTPDFPGPMRRVVEEQLGGACFFLQGAAGDLGPRRGFTGDLAVYRQLGRELGLAAASIASRIEVQRERSHYRSVMPSGANIAQYDYESVEQGVQPCAILALILKLPVKQLPSVAWVEAEFESLRIEVQRMQEAGDVDAMRLVQAKATQMGWRLENAIKYGHLAYTDWPMQVIRLGPVALVSMAGEPFSSIGQRIRDLSPATYTFVSGYSNGGFGYIPDRKAYETGGYEVEATPFSADAADLVVQEAVMALNNVFRTKEEL